MIVHPIAGALAILTIGPAAFLRTMDPAPIDNPTNHGGKKLATEVNALGIRKSD